MKRTIYKVAIEDSVTRNRVTFLVPKTEIPRRSVVAQCFRAVRDMPGIKGRVIYCWCREVRQ